MVGGLEGGWGGGGGLEGLGGLGECGGLEDFLGVFFLTKKLCESES